VRTSDSIDHELSRSYSTKADRAYRSARRILPVKVLVRQLDGSITEQRIDASVKSRNRGGSRGADRRIAIEE
jgi:hypothetical protein